MSEPTEPKPTTEDDEKPAEEAHEKKHDEKAHHHKHHDHMVIHAPDTEIAHVDPGAIVFP